MRKICIEETEKKYSYFACISQWRGPLPDMPKIRLDQDRKGPHWKNCILSEPNHNKSRLYGEPPNSHTGKGPSNHNPCSYRDKPVVMMTSSLQSTATPPWMFRPWTREELISYHLASFPFFLLLSSAFIHAQQNIPLGSSTLWGPSTQVSARSETIQCLGMPRTLISN